VGKQHSEAEDSLKREVIVNTWRGDIYRDTRGKYEHGKYERERGKYEDDEKEKQKIIISLSSLFLCRPRFCNGSIKVYRKAERCQQ
jgi:hypothetical protein